MKKTKLASMITAAVVILGVSLTLASQKSDRIESSAKKSYVFKTYLKNDDITIKVVNDDIVTLTGTVTEWSHRALAEETVAGFPGVKRVDNKLKVKDESSENSDTWIGMKVKTMLLFHQNVSGFNTEVHVSDGIVTLTGEAANEAQKELTVEYVKDVDGVKNVTNNMTVEKSGKTTVQKAGDTIDDASITAQVKLALLFHHSTSAIKTNVETKNGIVTVRGIAQNSAEKALVGKLVNDIKGVKGLINEITIGQISME
ncbi:MAG: hypothetical protein A2268_11685 [Candidatus Raymondbacteria bacterium RifOxyA12_full_50_37]|uniref:BON domain-containing protein n=1 Tax=Candidatus Raymondbacteria bacterium RIFOXYD12_FULL_49_13 TaxID=1817890 RepID=A0A1F7F3R3_UNCRA|nr:MAG: hypothetical protein A2268_11685 [Candidatus Raymondbacteria bacterium RifOxyA12_full_50_37]OGJ85998.1 MAG: hypothetical protein A2248_00520 [Candidatus Raymondbacteria bacterium RIFOXYA2_FULL_49_16]OGJ93786.1 MAG: hypothetical protein A2350_09735 [Candidatus Raymondbacteria bacterium RifOxyB12_full_50_8]OGJ97120.1 MAG: hypothetical protein A2453_12400 [Candidatus Raymondbacteria bacterium RIFOXYC2_FULL_50_21]OGK01177.1 MAG: hypothetical protein A2519_01495 [Candidatus Raymondbacteria b